jgi:hypothetical protein
LPLLTLESLKTEARAFTQTLSATPISALYGTTDGKAVGTYVEQLFRAHLGQVYTFQLGSSSLGIDFPDLQVDLKVTSIKQPQSSCPFRDASQKVYGLGYHLIVMIYDKTDDIATKTAKLSFQHVVFVDRQHTADYQTTSGLLGILSRDGNQDDIIAFLIERNLPLEEIGLDSLAKRILQDPPQQGYLTISNALQWRLQYSRIIGVAAQGDTRGIENLLV